MSETTDEEKLKRHAIQASALRQACIEVLQENRAEILKRAKAKLVALGVTIKEDELDTIHGA